MHLSVPWARHRLLAASAALAACCTAVGGAAAAPAQAPAEPPMRLQVVGGLAGVNQFTRHEEPFWTTQLARLSAGRYTAEIVPFDRAGMRGQDMLSLLQKGTVPFGTVLVALASHKDPEVSMPDLAGLNPDMKALRRNVAAVRPYLQSLLRERYGVEMLALYVYPAQVVFCNKPFAGVDGLKGLRVRTASPTQADWVAALGALPVVTSFVDLVPNLKAGNIDCAITGSMSGNTLGLQELTTHLHPLVVNWGLSIFGANAATWNALPADLQALLKRELPVLEKAIWEASDRETDDGIACNVGAATCVNGRRGRMTLVASSVADEQRSRAVFATAVLPAWLQRCGASCAAAWNRTIAPVVGVEAPAR